MSPAENSMPQSGSGLGKRAEELRRRVREAARRETESVLAEGLQARRDELAGIVQRAEKAAQDFTLLRQGGVHVVLNRNPLTRLGNQIRALRQEFHADPVTLTRPGGFDHRAARETLAAVQTTLQQAWQRHVGAPEGDDLADMLQSVPRYQSQVQQLRRLSDQLRQAAQQLPRTAEQVQTPARVRNCRAEVIASLDLARADLDLLVRVQTEGVPLLDLLDDAARLERLRERGFLGCMRVVM